MNQIKATKSTNISLFIIFLTVFIDYFALGVAFPIFTPLYFDVKHSIFDPSVLLPERTLKFGLMAGFWSLGQFFGAPILGAISDRIGRRKVIAFAFTVNIFCYLLFALGIFMKEYYILLLARTLAGLGGTSLPIVQSAIADHSSEENKAKNFGLVGVGFGLGFIMGALLGGLLSDNTVVSWFNFATPFFFIAILSVINVIFLWLNFPDVKHGIPSSKVSALSGFRNIGKAFGNSNLRNIFTVIFIMNIGFVFFIVYYQFYAEHEYHFDTSQLGYVIAYFSLWVGITQGIIIRPMSKIFTPVRGMLIFMPLFAISYILMLIPNNLVQIFLWFPFLPLFQGMVYPNSLAIVSNSADKTIQGEIIGINQSVISLSSAIPTILAGIVVSQLISFTMWLGAVCTLIAWFIFYLHHWKKRQPKFQDK